MTRIDALKLPPTTTVSRSGSGRSSEKGVDDAQSGDRGDAIGTHREHVRIFLASRPNREYGIVSLDGANAQDLVCDHGHPDSGSTDKDPKTIRPCCHSPRYPFRDFWKIVPAPEPTRSEVHHRQPLVEQMTTDYLLEGVPAVISAHVHHGAEYTMHPGVSGVRRIVG